jgi:hypothetical protein
MPPAGPCPIHREAPIAVQISQPEQQYHADLRMRSYELAKQRGHIRT